MSTDKIVLIHLLCYLFFFVVFLLYQFEIWNISESFMIWWARMMSIVETIILILTRFGELNFWGRFGMGTFYVLNIILLILQFIFADFGIIRKLFDLMWVGFYICLFAIDIFDANVLQTITLTDYKAIFWKIDNFLKNTFVGGFYNCCICSDC